MVRNNLTGIAFICLVWIIFPLDSLEGQTFFQEGMASFYADKFNGKTTANGEKYTHDKLTAAHLTLPFGTTVKVVNMTNNHTAVVRINDRGPFVRGRIIDLSKKAARKLDFIESGVVQVKLYIVENPDNHEKQSRHIPDNGVTDATKKARSNLDHEATEASDQSRCTPESEIQGASKQVRQTSDHEASIASNKVRTPDNEVPDDSNIHQSGYAPKEFYKLSTEKTTPSGYGVQIGSYKEMINLMRLTNELRLRFKDDVTIEVGKVNGVKVYRVIVGVYELKDDAEKLARRLKNKYRDCFVVSY